MNGITPTEQPPLTQPPAPEREGPSVQGKRWLIIVAIVVVGVMLMVGGFFLWRALGDDGRDALPEGDASADLRRIEERCAAAADPDACRSRELGQLAGETGSSDACGRIPDTDARVTCYRELALDDLDPETCDGIDDAERRTACRDSVYINASAVQRQLSLCDEITDQGLADRCREAFEGTMTAQECRELGREETVCAEVELIEQAVAAQDPDICEEILDAQRRGICEDEVGIADRDFDGLEAWQEERLGTDDRNPDTDGDGLSDGDEVHVWNTDPLDPDTDGDGFLDGAEVEAGFNPNGPGEI